MFNTQDYLVNQPWEGLIRMISDRTHLMLQSSHCELVSLQALVGVRTEVTFNTHRSESDSNLLPPLPKQLSYRYNRMDPAVYFNGTTLTFSHLKTPLTTREVLTEVTRVTGVTFDMDDFTAEVYDSYGEITLSSTPQSLRWIGQLKVRLINGTTVPLSSVVKNTSNANVFHVPSTGDTRKVDQVYFGSTDFTEHRFALEALADSPNGVEADQLIRVLKDVTGDNWVCQTTPAEFNFGMPVGVSELGYLILYSGPPVERYTTRKDKRRLIVLATDETLCTGFRGRLLFHYD